MYNPFSIADRIILVTGASSGIGRSTAIECSRMVSVSAILSCRPFFILIFLPCIKMNHYGFSRKSIWKNLETFP